MYVLTALPYNLHKIQKILYHSVHVRRVSRGGGALKIEKPKKKGYQGKFSAISPILCYIFSLKYYFLSSFLSWAPPPSKIEKQKKKAFRFCPPPPYQFLDTRLHIVHWYADFMILLQLVNS